MMNSHKMKSHCLINVTSKSSKYSVYITRDKSDIYILFCWEWIICRRFGHSILSSVKSNFVTTWLRDISSWPNELRDKMHFVTSVCVKRYVDRHEHMSRSYTSKSRSYRLSRTCAGHEPICREHPTPLILQCYLNSKLIRPGNTSQFFSLSWRYMYFPSYDHLNSLKWPKFLNNDM